jgi:NADH-quinone oxidoreductase subunit D
MSTTLNDPAQRDANMDDAPQSDITTINMGPQHPSTHGVLRLVLKLEGESVLQVTPEIGYLHTGIEKTAEFKTYQQALTLTDRMDYLAPLSNNLGYSLAVEKLLGIRVPPRAEVARVLLVELQRIASHLVWLGSSAIDLGALSVFLYAFQDREQILDIFELASGVRMMTSYIMPGGLTADLPPGFEDKVRAFLDYFPKRLAEYHNLLSGNEIWLERTRGLCYLNAETARQYSITGPALRAAGVDWDLRRDMPYSGYETYDFAVPVAQEGDVYARYSVRMLEMAESLKIVTQALERLPGGRWQVDDPKIVPPPKYEIAASMEALIHHFKLYTAGFRPPVGEVYQRIESPRGELGFYIVSDGGARPYRMRVRGPSFANVQVLSVMLRGGLLADVVAGIASMDFILGEVDR